MVAKEQISNDVVSMMVAISMVSMTMSVTMTMTMTKTKTVVTMTMTMTMMAPMVMVIIIVIKEVIVMDDTSEPGMIMIIVFACHINVAVDGCLQ